MYNIIAHLCFRENLIVFDARLLKRQNELVKKWLKTMW